MSIRRLPIQKRANRLIFITFDINFDKIDPARRVHLGELDKIAHGNANTLAILKRDIEASLTQILYFRQPKIHFTCCVRNRAVVHTHLVRAIE